MYPMEYYLALKLKGILKHMITWMNILDTALNKVSHRRTEVTEDCIIPLIEADSRRIGGRARWKGKWEIAVQWI